MFVNDWKQGIIDCYFWNCSLTLLHFCDNHQWQVPVARFASVPYNVPVLFSAVVLNCFRDKPSGPPITLDPNKKVYCFHKIHSLNLFKHYFPILTEYCWFKHCVNLWTWNRQKNSDPVIVTISNTFFSTVWESPTTPGKWFYNPLLVTDPPAENRWFSYYILIQIIWTSVDL